MPAFPPASLLASPAADDRVNINNITPQATDAAAQKQEVQQAQQQEPVLRDTPAQYGASDAATAPLAAAQPPQSAGDFEASPAEVDNILKNLNNSKSSKVKNGASPGDYPEVTIQAAQ